VPLAIFFIGKLPIYQRFLDWVVNMG
jgi:hypothetical protein